MADSPPLPPALASLLGPAGLLTDASDLAPALADWRSLYQGRALALLRPANTAELAEAVRLCAGAGIAIVPQG
ncbi:MAG: FAD-binding oxidoreductase, partial [Roseomonas sp.]|nr:FAD-binding oxidoreductase [Roseomonas sp.]